jgi:hypothetical protein
MTGVTAILAGMRGGAPLSVSAPNVEEFQGGFASAGTVTGSTTATVTGGTSPFTFAWTRLSGDFPTISSASAQNPTFSALVGDGAPNSSTWRVTVTDANSNTATADISVDLYWVNFN